MPRHLVEKRQASSGPDKVQVDAGSDCTGNTEYMTYLLAQHQQCEQWTFQELAKELHRWWDIFDFEFKLQIPKVPLRLERMRASRHGHFLCGHNEFGLQKEIAINTKYVSEQAMWRVLGTLFHEQLHLWQNEYGRPGSGNYHNAQYRMKALGYGLVVDQGGCTEYQPSSPFMDLLKRFGVNAPELPTPTPRMAGSSKLKLWSCGCTRVRVAVSDFQARCLRPGCGNRFVLKDAPAW
jgi:hypothetical protein